MEIPAQAGVEQLFKVRLTLYVGAASEEGVARSPERPTHPFAGPPDSADLSPRRPLAGNFVQPCGRLLGLRGAAAARRRLGLRSLSQTVRKLPRKERGVATREGAAATFLASAPLPGE